MKISQLKLFVETSSNRISETLRNGHAGAPLRLFFRPKGPPGLVKKNTSGLKTPLRTTKAPRKISESEFLREILIRLCQDWFPTRPDLRDYAICWSRRPQKRVLASCNVQSKKITVARELDMPEYHCWLEPLIYHELCHAYLGHRVSLSTGRNAWHDAEFKSLEARHPQIQEFDAWIKARGWERAVRSDRARRVHQKRLRSRG